LVAEHGRIGGSRLLGAQHRAGGLDHEVVPDRVAEQIDPVAPAAAPLLGAVRERGLQVQLALHRRAVDRVSNRGSHYVVSIRRPEGHPHVPRLDHAVRHEVELEGQVAGAVAEPKGLAIAQRRSGGHDDRHLLGLAIVRVVSLVQNQGRHREETSAQAGLDGRTIIGRPAHLQLVLTGQHAAGGVVVGPGAKRWICRGLGNHLPAFGKPDDHVVDVDARAPGWHGGVGGAELEAQLQQVLARKRRQTDAGLPPDVVVGQPDHGARHVHGIAGRDELFGPVSALDVGAEVVVRVRIQAVVEVQDRQILGGVVLEAEGVGNQAAVGDASAPQAVAARRLAAEVERGAALGRRGHRRVILERDLQGVRIAVAHRRANDAARQSVRRGRRDADNVGSRPVELVRQEGVQSARTAPSAPSYGGVVVRRQEISGRVIQEDLGIQVGQRIPGRAVVDVEDAPRRRAANDKRVVVKALIAGRGNRQVRVDRRGIAEGIPDVRVRIQAPDVALQTLGRRQRVVGFLLSDLSRGGSIHAAAVERGGQAVPARGRFQTGNVPQIGRGKRCAVERRIQQHRDHRCHSRGAPVTADPVLRDADHRVDRLQTDFRVVQHIVEHTGQHAIRGHRHVVTALRQFHRSQRRIELADRAAGQIVHAGLVQRIDDRGGPVFGDVRVARDQNRHTGGIKDRDGRIRPAEAVRIVQIEHQRTVSRGRIRNRIVAHVERVEIDVKAAGQRACHGKGGLIRLKQVPQFLRAVAGRVGVDGKGIVARGGGVDALVFRRLA